MNDLCIATPPPTDSSLDTQRNDVHVQCAPLAQNRQATVVFVSQTCTFQADSTVDC